MKVYCEVRETKEVYEAYKEKAVASIQGEFRLSSRLATILLEAATIDDPIHLYSENMWIEKEK